MVTVVEEGRGGDEGGDEWRGGGEVSAEKAKWRKAVS